MILTLDSPNTTRIFGRTPLEVNVAVSQFIFGRGSSGITLAGLDNPLDALAALALTHHPFPGPVILVPPTGIDPILLDEIRRLASESADDITQAILIGPLGQHIEDQLVSLGLRVTRITGMNAYHTAAEIGRFLGYPNDMMLVSGQDPYSGQVSGAMAAHRGIPIVFTLKDRLPQETIAVIKAAHEPANVFIIGGRDVISDETEEAVRGLVDGTVSRIAGKDLFELAVRFAKYKSADGRFGFGKVARHGHAFTFVNPGRWQDSIFGSMLAHSGKHAPILFLAKDEVPPVTRDYLLQVNPAKAVPEPPYMHAFIIGDFQAISPGVQLDIENLMSIDQQSRNPVVHTVEPHENLFEIPPHAVTDMPHTTREQDFH
ncbi:MAG TPA: cell wall-binding repeat-containing protein [Bacillota bacterium]|nr:cell wall-binding repeat-containing protein [Bacillota bacterium]